MTADLKLISGKGKKRTCDRGQEPTLCPGLEKLVVDSAVTRKDLDRIFDRLHSIDRKLDDIASNLGVLVEHVQVLLEVARGRSGTTRRGTRKAT